MCVGLLATPSNFKWPEDGIYIGLQVELAVWSHYLFFLRGHQLNRWGTIDSTGHTQLQTSRCASVCWRSSHRLNPCIDRHYVGSTGADLFLFISFLQRWSDCTDALIRCTVGLTGAEDLLSGRLTCSLDNSTVNASTPISWPSVQPVLWFLHLVFMSSVQCTDACASVYLMTIG